MGFLTEIPRPLLRSPASPILQSWQHSKASKQPTPACRSASTGWPMPKNREKKPEAVLDESAKLNKTEGTPYSGFIRWGFLENLKIAKELGLLTPEGMAELRRGKSATITKGQYTGQEAEADHVIPKAVCPELQNQVMNLELLPASLNRAKSDKVTDRARVFAKELYQAKLLSEEGFDSVQRSLKE